MLTDKDRFRFLTNPILLIISIVAAVPLGLAIRNFTQVPSDSFIYNAFNAINSVLFSVGGLYLNLLEMVIYPIVLAAIITSLSGLMKSKYLGQFLIRFILVFAGFYFIFSIAGVISGTLFGVGEGFGDENLHIISEAIEKDSDELVVSLLAPSDQHAKSNNFFLFLVNLFPKNIFLSLVNDVKIQVVVFAIMFGIAIGMIQGKIGECITQLFSSILDVFREITNWTMYILPIGVFCMLSTQVATVGTGILLAMAKFIMVFFSVAMSLLIFNTLIIWKRSRKSFIYVCKVLLEPVIVSLVSRNSFATLPVAVKTMDTRLNFFERTSSLLLPFGITIGRFGNILYFSTAAIFVAQLYGLELSLGQLIVVMTSSILAGIATAGASGVATVSVLSFVLVPLGLPADAVIAVFVAIDVLVDPIRTLLIVHTNIAATSLIAEPRATEGDRRLNADKLKPLISLRASVVVLIIVSIALSGLTTFVAAYQGSKRSVYYIAENMMQEMASAVADKTTNYMKSAEAVIQELKYLLEKDGDNWNNDEKFLQLLREILQINNEIGAIYLGTSEGSFAMTKRMLDGSYSYRVIERSDENVTINWTHENSANSEFFKNEILPVDQGYDPRTRGWYNFALDKNELIWEDVYVFSSDRIPGVTCAMPVYKDNGELIGVLGVDIGIAEFSFFLGDLSLSKTGEAVLLNNKDEIIAVGTDKSEGMDVLEKFISRNPNIDKLELILAEDSQDEIIRESYLTYQYFRGAQQLPVFTVNGDKYISFYNRFNPNDYFSWSMGIVIPEKTLMAQVNRNNIIVITLASLFIVISLLFGLSFSKSISKPLYRLSQEMEKVRAFSLDDIEEVPSVIKEVNEMNHSFINMVTGLRSFNKYVPSNLVSKMIGLGKEAVIGGEKKTLTLFFSDIKDFTSISEQLDPEFLVEDLEKYLSIMSKTIIRNSGTVDKYMGDGIMAFWGAPDEVKDHAVLACYAALECQAVLKHTAKKNPESVVSNSLTRIGINTGEVIVGNMGSEERLDYTVIGDSVNLASRLEALNKIYGTSIIISESTYNVVRDYVDARLLDKVAVKGKNKGIRIHELVSRRGELSKGQEKFLRVANYGVALYFNREWEKASSVFLQLLQHRRHDIPVQIMLERCQKFLKEPPPENWDGSNVLHRK